VPNFVWDYLLYIILKKMGIILYAWLRHNYFIGAGVSPADLVLLWSQDSPTTRFITWLSAFFAGILFISRIQLVTFGPSHPTKYVPNPTLFPQISNCTNLCSIFTITPPQSYLKIYTWIPKRERERERENLFFSFEQSFL